MNAACVGDGTAGGGKTPGGGPLDNGLRGSGAAGRDGRKRSGVAGVGVREYYKKIGYKDDGPYVSKMLAEKTVALAEPA